MALSPSELARVSRLLDEALELDAAGRLRWLQALPAEHAALVPALREMLMRDEQTPAHLLDRVPRLPDEPCDAPPLGASDRVGPYRLIRELGRGGMGMVWLAERADGTLKRQVALKLPTLAWAPGLGERMRRERDILAVLEHPNIARLYDAGVDALGRPYLAMEYVEGRPIDAYCRENGLPVADRLALFLQVARAVSHAHARLIVHRDLKPNNVLVASDGTARLLDFGIAKLLQGDTGQATQLTAMLGQALTPAYASPEQLKGEPVTVASDVYSLGVLLYELLTGLLPHPRKTAAAVELARLDDDAPAASSRVRDRSLARQLRGDLDAILAKALRADASERYATSDALADDVQRYLDGDPVRAQPDRLGYRLRKALRRHWRVAGAGAAVVLAVLAGAGVSLYQAQRATRALERERAVKEFVAEMFRANTQSAEPASDLQTVPASVFLERSARLVQARFSAQPVLQAELYGVVSSTFTQMGAHRLAADYARRQIEALVAAGDRPQEQARASIALATALLQDGHVEEAGKAAARAIELAPRHSLPWIDARVIMARVLLRRGEQNAAARELDGIEAAIAQRGGPPIIALARVQALRAGLLTAANRRDDALPMYDAAIDMALALEGPQSATAIDLRLNVAYTLASTRFVDRAQRYFDAAVAGLRARGGDHVTRAALESARFATTRHISYRQVTSRAAREAVAAARAELSAAGRVLPAEMAARLAFWEAQIALGAGDIEAALPLTERSVPLLLTLESALAERLSYVSHYGHFLMVAGRHEEADRWLRERLRLRVELGAAAHPYHAFDYTFVAYNLMMQSRAAEALAFLDKAPHFEPIRGEGARNPDRYNQVVQLARSDILWASGDPQHALQVFPHGILTGDPEDARAGLAVLGPVLCALGRSAEGMDALQRVMPTIDGDGYPHDVGVASMRAVAGKCVLQQGDRGRALALARQARAAFDAQPHAAPYYEAPLLKLEEALGIRERDAAGGRAGRRSKSG